MKIAFSTLACPDWTWREIIENGCRYGYDGVEIRLLERETDLLALSEFQPAQRSRRVKELTDAGFQICGLGSSVRFDHADASECARDVEVGRAYLELARDLGAGFVRVFGDVLPDTDQPAARQQTMRRIVEGLNVLGEFGETLGVNVVIETHGDYSDSGVVAQTLRDVASPAVGVLWDTHHPWRFCGESLEETHQRLGRWVTHTHWKDSVSVPRFAASEEADAAANAAHALMSGHRHADYVLFGGGEFPAAECMALLDNAGYSGWYSYEWEKMWHAEIERPEIALPLFPEKLRRLSTRRG